MNVRYLVLFVFLLVSCQPKSDLGQASLSAGNSSTEDGSIPSSELNWYYLNSLTKFITINFSNSNNAYISGSPVEYYLKTLSSEEFSTRNYCLVSEFNISGVTYQYRAHAIPISYYDFTAQRTVRIFRVDFQDVTNAQDFCRASYDLYSLNSSGNYQFETSTNVRLDPTSLCASCTSVLTGSTIRLFHVNGTNLEEIPPTSIDFNLTLKVDPNNNASANTGTCSVSDCTSRGYDCCLDDQCIRDGATRPSASIQYSSELLVAEQEKLQNPLAYLNYPQLYYICGSSVPTTL